MNQQEYKMLQFHKKRNKYIYEVQMISDLVTALQKLFDDVFVSYIRKCDAELFDEDFVMLCDQLEILSKDIYNYSSFKESLPHPNFALVKYWNAAPQ